MQPLIFKGRVEKGEGIMGSQVGCPTANISIEQGAVIPPFGVYVAKSECQSEQFPSIVIISGGRTGTLLKMEVHVLDKTIDLNGKKLIIELFDRIRDIIPYPGQDEISRMLKNDIVKAREWFKLHSDMIPPPYQGGG